MQERVEAEAPSADELRLQRNLKIIVVVMGVLLFAGLAAIIGRIIYLASRQPVQPAAVAVEALSAEQTMQLPAGADVRSISLSGDRLAVHYIAAGREGIAVLDLKTGKPLARVGIERRSPTN